MVRLKDVESPPLPSPASKAVWPAFTSRTARLNTVMISAKLTGGGLDWFIFSLIGKSAAARAPPPRLAKGTWPLERPGAFCQPWRRGSSSGGFADQREYEPVKSTSSQLCRYHDGVQAGSSGGKGWPDGFGGRGGEGRRLDLLQSHHRHPPPPRLSSHQAYTPSREGEGV